MARGDLPAIAGEAQQLLDNKVLNAALETQEREVLRDLEQLGTIKTPDKQKEANQLIYHFQTIRDFKRKLRLTVEATKLRNVSNE